MFLKTILTYNQLIKHNVHIGHSKKNTSILSSWMLLGMRQDVWLIDIDKTLSLFRISFSILRHIISARGPVWFINLNVSVENFIRHFAFRCGEFFCSSGWIRGMLSNYVTVGMQYSLYLNKLSKGFAKRRHHIYEHFFLTRLTWPRGVFISGAKQSLQAVKECRTMNIPCIAICDTNFQSHYVNFAIPGNDDSISALIFYNSIVSQFIVYLKFCSVFLWYLNVNRFGRFKAFENWVFEKLLHSKQNNFVLNVTNNLHFFSNAFLFVFSAFQKDEPMSMFRLFSFELSQFDLKSKLLLFSKNKLYSLRIVNVFFLKKTFSLPLLWIRGRLFKDPCLKLSKLSRSKLNKENFGWLDVKARLLKFYFFFYIWLGFCRSLKNRNYYVLFLAYYKILLKQYGAFTNHLKLTKLTKFHVKLRVKKFLFSGFRLSQTKIVKPKTNRASFFIGWCIFNKAVTCYSWSRRDFSFFFLKRVVSEWVWYFWRFNKQFFTNSFYKGPGFDFFGYNYYFLLNTYKDFDINLVDLSFLESSYFYLNYFFKVEILNIFNFKKSENLLVQLKVKSMLIHLKQRSKMLYLFDKRFDFVRIYFAEASRLRMSFYLKWLKLVKVLFLFLRKNLKKEIKPLFIRRCVFFLIKKIKAIKINA